MLGFIQLAYYKESSLMYDNSAQVFAYARKVVTSHSLLRDNVLRTNYPTLASTLDKLSTEVASLMATEEKPFQNKEIATANPLIRNYVEDLTYRLRFNYKHGELTYQTQLRIPTEVGLDILMNNNASTTVSDCLTPFREYWQYLNTQFGFSDFSILSTDIAVPGGQFAPSNLALLVNAGSKIPADYSNVERAVAFRIEGVSTQVIGSKTQTLKTSITLSGYEIATSTNNVSWNDYRITNAEDTALIDKVEAMQGNYLGVTGTPVVWKKYVNVLNRSVQGRLR